MLQFIKGQLVSQLPDSPRGSFLVVENNGLGYELQTSARSVMTIGTVGDTVMVFTSLIVREDSLSLVGFASKEERDLFNILQSASGVGVKVALSLLSTLSVPEIAQAVVTDNHKILTQAKGIGPKLAQKIVLDLKEKMKEWREHACGYAMQAMQGDSEALSIERTEALIEAETVLLSLGYAHSEIIESFQQLKDKLSGLSSEGVLRESLRVLALTG